VARVAFSPDGTLLAAVTEQATAQLWDVAGGRLAASLDGDLFRFHCVVFSPDGQRVLAGGGDWKVGGVSQVTVWDVAGKKQVQKLIGHRNAILCVACSPDGKTIATGGVDHDIHLWEADSGKHLRTLRGHRHWVESVAFTDGGRTLVSGSHDGSVRFWDVSKGVAGKRIDVTLSSFGLRKDFAGPPGRVRAVHFTPDGKILLVGGGPRTLKLFDVATRHEVDSLWKAPAADVTKVRSAEAGKLAQARKLTMDDLPPIEPSQEVEESGGSGRILLLVLAAGFLLALGLGSWHHVRRRRHGDTSPLAAATSVSFQCTTCGKTLRARAALAGKRCKCPKCGALVSIPDATST
jgi:dipeptidyl aminopeptidase/acylaminoacyl peptidase